MKDQKKIKKEEKFFVSRLFKKFSFKDKMKSNKHFLKLLPYYEPLSHTPIPKCMGPKSLN